MSILDGFNLGLGILASMAVGAVGFLLIGYLLDMILPEPKGDHHEPKMQD